MENLNVNGYVVQNESDFEYKGINGDNWFMNYVQDTEEFREFYNKNIDRAWLDINYVDCCNNKNHIINYIHEAKKRNISVKILLCCTPKNAPRLLNPFEYKIKKFLGYDYAYSGGSYYSAVLNDVIDKRIPEFNDIKLNENGLFSTYEEVTNFVIYREKIKKIKKEYFFEDGNFIIYKLFQVSIMDDKTSTI